MTALTHCCPSAALQQGEETARILELWEDSKGANKGEKRCRMRWLFYPHHLPDDHKERTRARTGLQKRQVYEQCDPKANDQMNPLASVRALQRVVCCWKSKLNRMPSNEEVRAAHAWFESGWDNKRLEVVKLDQCVDAPASGESLPPCARWCGNVCVMLP